MNNVESKAYIMHGPKDHGPLYKETDMSRFPVEPFNTFSNLIFLFLVIYWSWKTRLNTLKHPLTTVCMPILLLGFIGGTVYHATRSSSIWIQLDVLPILVLALSAGIFLWRMMVKKWIWTFLLTLGPWIIYYFISRYVRIPEKYLITTGYLVLASNILLPAVLFCILRNRQAWLTLTLSLASFAAAIAFRVMDRLDVLKFMPQGTHFLWHIFGGICGFFLIKYIYLAENIDARERKDRLPHRSHE